MFDPLLKLNFQEKQSGLTDCIVVKFVRDQGMYFFFVLLYKGIDCFDIFPLPFPSYLML